MAIISTALAHFKRNWKILAAGQFLSFLFSCMSASQAALALDCSANAPMFTLVWFYLALGCLLCCFRSKKAGTESQNNEDQDMTSFRLCMAVPKPVMYFVMAVLDVYANYFVVVALSYTTITSVTLLDALAVPASMILSRCFLKRSYTYIHLLGVLLCLSGVIVNVSEDYTQVKTNTAVASNMVKGDVLAIIGGILFGVNKVLGEISVRNFGGPFEYLGYIGMFGAVIAIVHSIIFERQAISQTFVNQGSQCSQGQVWGLMIAFFFSGFFTYLGGAQFLLVSEATFYNLSLLTADAWSLAFSILAERIIPAPLFFLALFFTLLGVVVYEMAPTPIMEDREAEEAAIETSLSGEKEGDIELKVQEGEAA